MFKIIEYNWPLNKTITTIFSRDGLCALVKYCLFM